jgi:hypothetical protein
MEGSCTLGFFPPTSIELPSRWAARLAYFIQQGGWAWNLKMTRIVVLFDPRVAFEINLKEAAGA